MISNRYRLGLLAPAMAVSSLATAQAPATPEACLAIEADATRLACYDQAMGRAASDTQAADAAAQMAAELARQEHKVAAPDEGATLRERARHRLGSVFGNDDQYAEARANAGKGSLLDSRWELAKD
jgi:phospholipase A1